jgi:hypothetical protein
MPGGRTRASTRSRPPHQRGRPSSLTAATIKSIEKQIRSGSSYADAAKLAGIDPRTFQAWLAKGRDDLQAGRASEYLHFYQRVEVANIGIKTTLIERVIKGSRKDPRLALKILERRFPDEWGLKIKIEDATPDRPPSPRETFLKRLSVIEDRQHRADAALRGVMRHDEPSLAEGANGGSSSNGHDADDGALADR